MNTNFDPDTPAIQLLANLEKELYLQGDVRYAVIKDALDYLHDHKIINLDYQPNMLSMAQSDF